MDDAGGQRAQVCSYKNKFWRSKVQHGDYNNAVLYTWKLLSVDLNHSHHTKRLKLMSTMWGNGCLNDLDLANCSIMYMFIKSSHCTF